MGYTVFAQDIIETLPVELSLVRDSKLLSRSRREALMEPIRKHSQCSGVVMHSSRKIDSLGINQSIEDCMIQAIHRTRSRGIAPVAVLIDGNYPLKRLRSAFPELQILCLVGGDNRVFSIACASIVAKALRDRRMLQFDQLFPGYDFGKHAGYGTAHHRNQIKSLGLSPLHRRSFKLKN